MKYSVQVEYIQTWDYDNIEASTEDEAEQIALCMSEDEECHDADCKTTAWELAEQDDEE